MKPTSVVYSSRGQSLIDYSDGETNVVTFLIIISQVIGSMILYAEVVDDA
jgi:hypothetical protein